MKEKLSRFSVYIVMISMSLGLTVTGTSSSAKKAVKLSLNYSSLSLSVTGEEQLFIKKLKKKEKKKVSWSSSDESVATVSEIGYIRTWKPGKAKVKAEYKKKTYTCRLTVTGPSEGRFYLPLLGKETPEETTAEWVYKDSWFMKSAEKYERELAALSALLCWSSGPAKDKPVEEQFFYLKRCLTALGFESFAVNDDYKREPNKYTFGVAYAMKTVKKGKKSYKLIVIVPRSSGYGSEWVSNLTLGKGTGDHEGFTIARDKLLTELNHFLQDHSVTGDIKLWFAGHSRGATACDLAEAYLADHPESLPEGISLKKQAIYGYNLSTIHAAGVTTQEESAAHEKDYPFIHNIELPYDLFTVLVPAYYGFDRYGVTHEISCTKKDEEKALKLLKKTDEGLYDNYKANIPSEHGVDELRKELVRVLIEKVPSRQAYVDEWQSKIGNVSGEAGLMSVFLPLFSGIKVGEININAATIQHYTQVLYSFLAN